MKEIAIKSKIIFIILYLFCTVFFIGLFAYVFLMDKIDLFHFIILLLIFVLFVFLFILTLNSLFKKIIFYNESFKVFCPFRKTREYYYKDIDQVYFTKITRKYIIYCVYIDDVKILWFSNYMKNSKEGLTFLKKKCVSLSKKSIKEKSSFMGYKALRERLWKEDGLYISKTLDKEDIKVKREKVKTVNIFLFIIILMSFFFDLKAKLFMLIFVIIAEYVLYIVNYPIVCVLDEIKNIFKKNKLKKGLFIDFPIIPLCIANVIALHESSLINVNYLEYLRSIFIFSIMGILIFIVPVIFRKIKINIFRLIMVSVMCLLFCFSMFSTISYIFPTKEVISKEVFLQDKREYKSTGHQSTILFNTSYYVMLDVDGQTIEYEINKKLYKKISKGDIVCLKKYENIIGVKYIIVED